MLLVSFWSIVQDCIDALFSLADISDGGNGILKSASVSESEILYESQPTFGMGPKNIGKEFGVTWTKHSTRPIIPWEVL